MLDDGNGAGDRVPEAELVADGLGGVIFGGGDGTVEDGEDGFLAVGFGVFGEIECLRASAGDIFPGNEYVPCVVEGLKSA